MSWIDRIENTVFSIMTGDSQLWFPDFPQGSESTTDFNTSVFDFINVAGSLVDRKKPKGDKYPLLFLFQGDDNIEKSNAFLASAKDSRPWIIQHPYYGIINGQPLSISRDSSNFNITKISVDFMETIANDFSKSYISIPDLIATRTEEFILTSGIDYGIKTKLTSASVNTVKDSANAITSIINKALKFSYYNKYQKIKNKAFASITNLILYPVEGINALQAVVLEPASFDISLEYRVDLITAVYKSILNTVTLKPLRDNKYYFEAAAGAAIAALASAFMAPLDGDLDTRVLVDKYKTVLKDIYSQYLYTLDILYAKDVEPGKTYSASPVAQEKLSKIVTAALSGLTDIAFSAKQERIVFTEKDEHLIVLVHRYIGLDQEDKNIDTFRKINNLRNKFLFLIPEGTQIRYYI
jgi:hypothetical protein